MNSQQNQQKTYQFINNTHSAKQSSIQGDGSIKRKIFSRKPGVNNLNLKSDKLNIKATNQTNYQLAVNSSRPDYNKSSKDLPDSSVKINFVSRKQRQTQYFNKNKKQDDEISIQNGKHIFYSPNNQKMLLHDNIKTMQTYPPKNNTQCKQKKDIQLNAQMIPNNLKRQSEKQQTNNSTNSIIPVNSYRQRTNILKIQSFSYISQKSLSKYKTQHKKTQSQNLNSLIQNTIKLQTSQCSYCKNNKQMINIINQKCTRLQQKNKQKNKNIQELTYKLSSMEQINKQLNKDYQRIVQIKQQKDMQIFKLRQQFHEKIQELRVELNHIFEKLKYVDIQNGILLRYKDQYNLITKEYDIKLRQNQELKKILAQNRHGEYRYGVFCQNKPHENVKEVRNNGNYQQANRQTNTYNNSLQNQVFYKLQQQPINIQYNNRIQEKNVLMAYQHKQDDQISLNLSQKSYDQY